MWRNIPRNRTARRATARALQPLVDGLEDRKLLYATLGDSFLYGSRITYSFVPDGTNIGGAPSALFATMAAKGFTTAQWEGAIQKAAAAWESVSNVNFVQVLDDGSALGAAGNQQGDSRFGDIRIGGSALSAGTLATCFLPPAANGGTLAGDIVFNDNASWRINSDYDLQTVAMHELGHALGLDHSALSTAEMYSTYNGMKQSLTADDISGIDAVYGARQPDAYDVGMGNHSFGTAADITSSLNSAGQATIASLSLAANQTDYFLITAPASASGTISVSMQSSNLSSLSPRVVLFDATQKGLAQGLANNVYGATVSASFSAQPGQKFYVKCLFAGAGGSAGSYALQVNFGTGAMSPITPPNTTVAWAPDQGGGSTSDSLDRGHQSVRHGARTSSSTSVDTPGGPLELSRPHSPRGIHGGRLWTRAYIGKAGFVGAKS